MLKAGTVIDDNFAYQYGEDFSMASGYAAVEYLCSLPEKATAILAFNNTLALGGHLEHGCKTLYLCEIVMIEYPDFNPERLPNAHNIRKLARKR